MSESPTMPQNSVQSADEESPSSVVDVNETSEQKLSSQELWNVTCLVLAFSCNICCLTLVVGSSAVAIQTVGGNDQLAPFGLGVMFLGMSLVSLTCTHWMFEAWGRKKGFFAGVAFGIFGVAIASIACYIESHELLIFSFLFLGAGCGMGMYLRFAAAEVVGASFRAKAMTWVLAGGCIAAFVGPETAEATRGAVGDDDDHHLTYVGTFWIAGAFYVGLGLFVSLVNFDTKESNHQESSRAETNQSSEMPDIEKNAQVKASRWDELKQVIQGQAFIIPVLVASLSWM